MVGIVETDVPARLDRAPWGRFHTLVVAALGITWILDGLEVTLAGALSGALKQSPTLKFSNTDIGLASSADLAGAVLGAIGSLVLFDPAVINPELGWRLAFLIGAAFRSGGAAIDVYRYALAHDPEM